MTAIVIAVPTFRRPRGLARLLDSLLRLQTTADVRILVGDNDAAGAGAALCRARAEGYPWPLAAIMVPERGIAQNRNALIAEALHDPSVQWIAMLDDDEEVGPGWLAQMLAAADAFAAEAVEGPVLALDEEGRPSRAIGAVARHQGASGPVAQLGGAGNILLSRVLLERLGAPWFDPAFALTGGEDRDFFHRLAARDTRCAWCAEAEAVTRMPQQRQTFRWMLRRAYFNGHSDMRIFLKYHLGAKARGYEGLRIAGALLAAPAAALVFACWPMRSRDMLRRLFRAVGKLAALLGFDGQQYLVSDGD